MHDEKNRKFLIFDSKSKYQVFLLSIFILALSFRLIYSWFGLIDFYDDSYHHYYIIQGSIENPPYADYKSNNYLWLPGFHYFGLVIQLVSGSNSIFILEFVIRMLGAITTVLVADIIYSIYRNYFVSFLSTSFLITSPWHIIFSNLFMPEIWASFCLCLLIKGWISQSNILVLAGWILGFFSRYENWFFGSLLLIAFILIQQNKKQKYQMLIQTGIPILIWFLIWSEWSLLGTGNPFYWFEAQMNSLQWDKTFSNSDYSIIEMIKLLGFSWIGYTIGLLGGFIFLIILLFHKLSHNKLTSNSDNKLNVFSNLSKNISEKTFLGVIAFVVLIRFIFLVFFTVLPDIHPRWIIIDLYLIILLIPGWIHFFRILKGFFNKKKYFQGILINKKVVNYIGSLVIIIVVLFSFILQLPVIKGQDYIINPSKKAGQFLGGWIIEQNFEESEKSNILIDSPSVAYFARLSFSQLISSEKISNDSFSDILKYKIRAIVLQNVSFSEVYYKFPFLISHPDNYSINEIEFVKIYEFDGWELQYGAKKILIYSLNYQFNIKDTI